jgi:hypothetical protein
MRTGMVLDKIGNVKNQSINNDESVVFLVVWLDVVEGEDFGRHFDFLWRI